MPVRSGFKGEGGTGKTKIVTLGVECDLQHKPANGFLVPVPLNSLLPLSRPESRFLSLTSFLRRSCPYEIKLHSTSIANFMDTRVFVCAHTHTHLGVELEKPNQRNIHAPVQMNLLVMGFGHVCLLKLAACARNPLPSPLPPLSRRGPSVRFGRSGKSFETVLLTFVLIKNSINSPMPH